MIVPINTTTEATVPNIKNPERLSEKVSKLVEDAILSGQYPPNSRLPAENDLAESFGVSRTAIREANQNLKANGLIVSIAGSGNYVTRYSTKQVQRAFERFGILNPDPNVILNFIDLRILVELETIRLVAEKHDKKTVKALEKIVAQMQETFYTDKKKYSVLDARFHMTLARNSGNVLFPVLIEPIEKLGLFYAARDLNLDDPILDGMEIGLHDHKKMLASIRKGDAEKSVDLMRAHLLRSRRNYLRNVAIERK